MKKNKIKKQLNKIINLLEENKIGKEVRFKIDKDQLIGILENYSKKEIYF